MNPRRRSRRTSSVGNIDVGDTVPSLGTMAESDASRRAAAQRMARLNSAMGTGDAVLWQRIWLSFREVNYRHTWVVPLIIITLVHGAYFASGNTTETNWLHQFVAVSYREGNSDRYGKGIKDLCFVFYYMIFFTFVREFLMEVIIKPFAIRCNINSRHKVKRMMEQVFSAFYYGISGPFGIYVMYHSDLWYFRTDSMYHTYPDLTNSYLFKVFYLGQAAFWVQQACVLVLQLEKPRKDHRELVFHHIVTLLLIWSSYAFHFTKIGLAVYISMDVSDFFLALSKTFNYLDSAWTPPMFVFFIGTWVYLRHYMNLRILWSLLTEFRTVGNYTLDFATQQYKCWISLPIIFVLISAVQILNLYWLVLILRILYRYIWTGVEKDERSDEESEMEQTKAE